MKLSYVHQGDIKIQNIFLNEIKENIFELIIETEQKYFDYCSSSSSSYSESHYTLDFYFDKQDVYKEGDKSSIISFIVDDNYYDVYFGSQRYGLSMMIHVTPKDKNNDYNCIYKSNEE